MATAKKTKAKEITTDDLDINIASEPPKPITVGLGGHRYTVRPVKGSLGIALGAKLKKVSDDPEKLVKAVTDITEAIFGKAEGAEVLKRLQDPEDVLDYAHIFELMNALVEKSTGNPTT